MKDTSSSEPGSQEQRLAVIVADILSGKQSVMDLLKAPQDGNYWGAVQTKRLVSLLFNNHEVVKVFGRELRMAIEQHGRSEDGSIDKVLSFKDGHRRFDLLLHKRAEAFGNGPSLLTGATFEECLSQYLKLLTHVENLWADSCQLFRLEKYPLAAFTSILVIEEIGKLAHLAQDLVAYDVRSTLTGPVADRDHRRKHIIGVMSGALINARLDRVLGRNVVKKLLHEAESDEFEKTRQSCLYIDQVGMEIVTPGERISAERARTLVVLCGELMVEVLGHFTWEFERMLENVIAFEREIGLPEHKIVRC